LAFRPELNSNLADALLARTRLLPAAASRVAAVQGMAHILAAVSWKIFRAFYRMICRPNYLGDLAGSAFVHWLQQRGNLAETRWRGFQPGYRHGSGAAAEDCEQIRGLILSRPGSSAVCALEIMER
jgi:hypothetical protein